MRTERTQAERLAARILENNPDFGSSGYLKSRPPMLNAVELLEQLRAPRSSTTRYLPGPWKIG